MSNTPRNTDLYLRLGVNTQAWREFCRAEQLLVQRDTLLAALRELSEAIGPSGSRIAPTIVIERARAAIAKAEVA
jgi:hypothetical protein